MKHFELEYEDDIYKIIVGENAQDNFDIISISSQNDLWFHLEHFSSPHVILQNPKNLKRNKMPKMAIYFALEACKKHSKFKTVTKKISFIYTEIKNIKKTNIIGQVISKKTTKITF